MPARCVDGSGCCQVGCVRHAYDRRRKDELALPFVTAEKERPVLDDRAPNHATKVIVSKFVPRAFEEVAGVEVVVS